MAKNKYDWTQFKLKIEIEVKPEKVYEAWTDAESLMSWFPVTAEIVPKKGGRLYLEWLGGDKLEAKVIAARKPYSLIIPFGAKGEELKVSIRKNGTGSICELHQYNMKTDPKTRVEMHMGCISGWVFFLTNLKSVLEHGIDLRGTDPERCYRQGYINS